MMVVMSLSSSLDTIALSSTGSNLGATDGGFADPSSGSGGGGDGCSSGGGVSIVGAGGGGEGGGSEGGGSAGGDEGGGGATTRATLTFAAVATLVRSGVTSTPKLEASCAAGALTRIVTAASTVEITAAAVAWLPSGAVSGMVRMTSTLMTLVVARRRRLAAAVARSARKHAGSRQDSSFFRLASSVTFPGDASKEATSVAETDISKEMTVEDTETTDWPAARGEKGGRGGGDSEGEGGGGLGGGSGGGEGDSVGVPGGDGGDAGGDGGVGGGGVGDDEGGGGVGGAEGGGGVGDDEGGGVGKGGHTVEQAA